MLTVQGPVRLTSGRDRRPLSPQLVANEGLVLHAMVMLLSRGEAVLAAREVDILRDRPRNNVMYASMLPIQCRTDVRRRSLSRNAFALPPGVIRPPAFFNGYSVRLCSSHWRDSTSRHPGSNSCRSLLLMLEPSICAARPRHHGLGTVKQFISPIDLTARNQPSPQHLAQGDTTRDHAR